MSDLGPLKDVGEVLGVSRGDTRDLVATSTGLECTTETPVSSTTGSYSSPCALIFPIPTDV